MKLKKSQSNIKIGIFGGSGFYELLENAKEIEVKTPYGKTSDKISVGKINGIEVAFMPRHGKKHQFSPSSIPYKANLWAFKELGIEKIIAPSAAGSLRPEIKPGDFVICDQFIDRTKHREETFYPGPKVIHVSFAEPYCPSLRKIAADSCNKLDIPVHNRGNMVIIEGPRFSTKAESIWYQKSGFEVINMTQYPEVALARELEMCYVNISLITDWDAGVLGDKNVKPVTADEVGKIFAENIDKVKKLISEMVSAISSKRNCLCKDALKNASL